LRSKWHKLSHGRSYLDDPKRRKFSAKYVSQVHAQPRYNCRVQGNFVDVLLGPVVRLWHSRRYYSLLPRDSLWTTSRNFYAFVSLGLDQMMGRREARVLCPEVREIFRFPLSLISNSRSSSTSSAVGARGPRPSARMAVLLNDRLCFKSERLIRQTRTIS
jgi:hypothetical protein